MKNILKLLMVCVLFTACDETEPVLFDKVNGQTLAAFGSTTSSLRVLINDTGTTDVMINSTTVATVDRTVSVAVDPATTANAENFSVPTSVVIPAGEATAVLTVTGVDNSVETTEETIVLTLGSVEGGIVGKGTHIISMFQVCPVPSDYLVGEYLLTDNGNGNFGVDVPVTIGIPADDENSRIFEATFLPGSGVDQVVVARINLVCNTFLFQTVDINVTCSQEASFIIGSAGDASSSYDTSDDTFVTVNYTEDIEADCGATSIQNFTLTKQ